MSTVTNVSRHRKTNRKTSAGSVIVEVALATTVLMLLVLACMDFGRMHFSRSRLQYAVSQAARFATIGSTLPDPSRPGTNLSRGESIVTLLRDLSGLRDLASKDVVVTSVDESGRSVAGPGGPGDVVVVVASYRVPLVTPFLSDAFGGSFRFTCRTTYRNEEFPG
jgi:hypothetical protein